MAEVYGNSACTATPQICLALRWRKPRTWANACTDASNSKANGKSRLCILRRRKVPAGSFAPAEWCDADSSEKMASRSHGEVTAFGIYAEPLVPPLSHQQQAPVSRVEAVAHASYIAMEGFSIAREAHHCKGDLTPSYTTAGLIEQLSLRIFSELTKGFISAPSSSHLQSSFVKGGSSSSPREVLTFSTGIQGCGKTTFLLGSLQDSHLMKSSTDATTLFSSHCGGLFGAVLHRIFDTADSHECCTVAMSVVEVRDAAPLLHPSVLQRPRETVDLLSGQLLHRQEPESAWHAPEDNSRNKKQQRRASGKGGECGSALLSRSTSTWSSAISSSSSSSASCDAAVDEPTDIPAACYVRVSSTAEAMHVLFTAVSSSLAWEQEVDAVPTAEHERSAGSATEPPLMRVARLPLDEKTSHLCITVLVGLREGAARGSADTERKRASMQSAVGIWKLWDLAGPSPACGYRPYNPNSVNDQKPVATYSDFRQGRGHRDEDVLGAADAAPPSTLPWCNRYSLPALTHTCLTRFGAQLQHAPCPAVPFLPCDAVALQIIASAMSSCSMVTPIGTLEADAAADPVNAEVLHSAAGWSQHRERMEKARATGSVQSSVEDERRRIAQMENAVAARRVLETYTVAYADFVRERSDFRVPASLSDDLRADVEHVAAQPRTRDDDIMESKREVVEESSVREDKRNSKASPTQPGDNFGEEISAKRVPVGFPQTSSVRATAPLSINVTASEEDQLTALRKLAADGKRDLSLQSCYVNEATAAAAAVPQKKSGEDEVSRQTPSSDAANPLTHLVHTPHRTIPAEPHTAELSERAQLSTQEASPASSTTPRPSTNAVVENRSSVAALCAAGAVEAEAARLRRFQGVFETESFASTEESVWTSQEVQALPDAGEDVKVHQDSDEIHSSAEGGHAEVNAAATAAQGPRTGTPAKRGGSPPSVLCTGLRDNPVSSSGSSVPCAAAAAAPLPSTPQDSSQEETFVCPPQALHFDVPELPGESNRHATQEATLSTTATTSREGQEETHATSISDAAGASTASPAEALVHFLTPYCEQFTDLFLEMRREMDAWRASEATSLQALSQLAEQHTHDVRQLAQLLQQTAAPVRPSDARRADWDGIVLESVAPAESERAATAAMAATSSLIFEQLVRSEEKVSWLEKQLVQWRQRSQETSTLIQQYTNNSVLDERGAEDGGEEEAKTRQRHADTAESDQERSETVEGPASRQSPLTAGLPIEDGTGAAAYDPTRRWAGQAVQILERLLRRCGRAYAAAQQRSTRWQVQLAEERAAKSALMDRVAELEKELAETRRRPQGRASASPTVRTSSQEADIPLLTNANHSNALLLSNADSNRNCCLASSADTPPHSPSGNTLHPEKMPQARQKPPLTSTTNINMSNRDLEVSAATIGTEHTGRMLSRSPSANATPVPVSPIHSLDDTALSLPSRHADLGHYDNLNAPFPLHRHAPSVQGSSYTHASTSTAAEVTARLTALLTRAVEGAASQDTHYTTSAPPQHGVRGGAVIASDLSQGPQLPTARGVALFNVRVGPTSTDSIGGEDAWAGNSREEEEEEEADAMEDTDEATLMMSPVASSLSPSLRHDGRAGGIAGGGTHSMEVAQGQSASAVSSSTRAGGARQERWRGDSATRSSSHSVQSKETWRVASGSESVTHGNWCLGPAEPGQGHDAGYLPRWDLRPPAMQSCEFDPKHSPCQTTPSTRAVSTRAVATSCAHHDDDDTYPTTALQRLHEAAAHLAANAVRLSSLRGTPAEGKHDNDDYRSSISGTAKERASVASATEQLRAAIRGDAKGVVSSHTISSSQVDTSLKENSRLTTPLRQSIEALRSASQAVQRDAREAAEREKAYLSTLLFSPESTPHR